METLIYYSTALKRNLLGKVFFLVFSLSLLGFSQTGSIKGKVLDADSGEPVAGATVFVIGTYSGGFTDGEGNFTVANVKKGTYSVRIKFVGYVEKVITNVKVEAGKTTNLGTLKLKPEGTTLDEVEIVGEKNMIDLESGKSELVIHSGDLQNLGVDDVQQIATMQVGVTQTPDGVQIRGGRVYETQYVVEGVSAQDPLAGTGFGVQVSKFAIDQVKIVTSGADAEYGDGTAGVILTKIKEGGERFQVSASYKKDNFGINHNQGMHWNSDVLNVAVGGPLINKNKKKHRVFFFVSGDMNLTDTYFRVQANQLYSSLIEEDSIKIFGKSPSEVFAPRQDNKWTGTVKLSYYITPATKIFLTTQQSLNINQNSRSLQIIGFDAIMTPGFQYLFSLQPDNGNTYTHKSNLNVLGFRHVFKKQWAMEARFARLFTNLRADANGRPFREETISQIYDPASIVTNPITLYNPGDTAVFVNPGPGLYNNDGIATLWHDHYAQEYTGKVKFTYSSKNSVHFFSFGWEHKEQEYQWIDVRRPWIGAPVKVNDSLTFSSNRIGQSSDIWKANPANGGLFFEDRIRYKGIIASLGFRFNYWAYGKFVDNAVENPEAPVIDVVRQEYTKQTVPVLGRRFKARLLPKVKVSFPVTENNVLFFNYAHAMRLPHPRFIYAGLDPVYQNSSYLSNLGNPNLKPEATVSYEVGLKSQVTQTFAVNVSAFYNDKYDYIVTRTLTLRDVTGRFVTKSFAVNQDYARVRGLEVSLHKKIGKWFKGMLNGSYQVATGKSNSARESLLQIIQRGRLETTREFYLAWDRPFEFKGVFNFFSDSTWKIGPVSFDNFVFTIYSTWKSGLRYTPYKYAGIDEVTGRPIYEIEEHRRYEKIGSNWFWTDVRITKNIPLFKKKGTLSVFFELQNAFNNKNAIIINPITGRAYEYGDPVPLFWRDPLNPNPLDKYLTPPTNPARYLKPRQMWWGARMNYTF